MPDIYDKEIERLTRECESAGDLSPIVHSWGRIDPLFGMVNRNPIRGVYGCLTQVRSGSDAACTNELTTAIRADERIPRAASDITVSDLPVFAEWQRRIDKVLGRTPPEVPA